MYVGVLQFELIIPWAGSLKDKRRVVRSVRDRLHREHLVSVAEVGSLDSWRTALMGAAAVSNSPQHLSGLFDRVLGKLAELPDAHLGEVSRHVLASDDLATTEIGEDGLPLWTEAERRSEDDEQHPLPALPPAAPPTEPPR